MLSKRTLLALGAAGWLTINSFAAGWAAAKWPVASRPVQSANTLDLDWGCYEDEIGIWMDTQTTCVPIDDILSVEEYNTLIERLYDLEHGTFSDDTKRYFRDLNRH